ncbi:hypothetical protein WICPIJ_006245 [Wickerhamomyces pijperi]|uniref:Uncharacterized protein n=1 Tax=Wickerhamomyces pijperi TaxID=599730 RepID=A0A9P8TL19_WICPI|nr:hypothetical protein WICPIJ_006245 [Wickerhamomyces pijperi]
MVGTSHNEQVGQHTGSDGTSVLLHLGLLGVWELRNNRSDLLSGTTSTGRNHDQKFHNVIINVLGPRLDHVHVFVTNGDANLNRGLTIGELFQGTWSWLDT